MGRRTGSIRVRLDWALHRDGRSFRAFHSLVRQTARRDESGISKTAIPDDKWIAAWNAYDLDLILAHYEDAIELTLPAAAQLLGTADGKVIGKANLKAYFRRGLEAYPELHFHLTDLLLGVNSVALYYANQNGTHVAEFMEFSENGGVARVVANCSALRA